MYSRRFSGLGMLRNFASQSRSARLASAEYPASVAGSLVAAPASRSPVRQRKITRTRRRIRFPPKNARLPATTVGRLLTFGLTQKKSGV